MINNLNDIFSLTLVHFAYHFVTRVDYGSVDSIFHGVAPSTEPYVVERFCECGIEVEERCETGYNVETCDSVLGEK